MTNENPIYPRAERFNVWLGQKGVLRDKRNFSNKALKGWADDFLKLMNLENHFSPDELVTGVRSIWGSKAAETRRRNKEQAQTPRMIGRSKEARAKADLAERQGELF